MFQNISEDAEENIEEQETTNKKINWNLIIKNMLKPQRILIYIISFLISTISFMEGQSVFALAMFAAACSSGTIALPIFLATLVGTLIGFGGQATLIYLCNTILFIMLMILIKPKLQKRNEKRKLGFHLVSAIFLVQAFQIFTASFTVLVLLETILQCLTIFIFYKIFANSIPVIEKLGANEVFTAEEAIGACLLMSLAVCAIGPVAIWGLEIRDIICALIVILLAWRNGALIGTTTGVTIGVILAVLGIGEEGLIIAYALAGLIVGLLNKTGKIGVVLALLLGFALVTFMDNESYFVYIKEILIAMVALLVLPENVSINIEDIIGKTKFLPVTKDNRLEENTDTIYKLNTVSQTINEIAKSYEEAAATLVEDQKEYLNKNKQIFFNELINNLESIKENILYEDLIEIKNGIADDIFEVLIKNDEIESDDLIKIFESHNSYILGMDDKEIEKEVEKQIFQVVKNINYTYQSSKLNFIWKKKISENNKIVSEQFNNVSKVIDNIADKMENEKQLNSKQANFNLSIGVSKTTKNSIQVSGDTNTQLKLKDGKYLLAISDGMGSGEKAKKSSQKSIKMLERMLISGFEKEESVKLINSVLSTNYDDEMYATLDIAVIDLNIGNVEILKSGACPTYIKSKNKVELIQESSTPAGMINDIKLTTFDKDLNDGDILVMCTDGILDASGKYKEEWLKDVLTDIQTKNVQKIADIIIREAIDQGLGIANDDMTVIVAKIEKI